MTSSTTPDAGQGSPGRRPARLLPGSRTHRRWVRLLVAVLAVVTVLLVADVAVLHSRVDRLDVSLRDSGDGTTWVLVGLDSRAELPAGARIEDFGTEEDVPGARTDVIVVVHERPDGTVSALSVPRDAVVRTSAGVARVALSWMSGPQTTVDALCDLGIPTDHLVAVDLAGFASVVDAAGGLDVDVPQPVRDPAAGLELTQAGPQHVDGATALALVRSRHPEHLEDGQWVPAPADPNVRATSAGTVLSALATAVRGAVGRPWRLQQLAQAGSAALAVDDGTSMWELSSLARTGIGPVDVLPLAEPRGKALARFPNADTRATLDAAGLSCDG
jgi:LCP family protein required for cell wall assembly